jgi:hypothetical protein
MAKNNQKNRQKAKVLAAKGASQKTIQQKTGVSKTAAKKFTQKAAAPTPKPTPKPTPPPTQATPTSFQVTPSTQTPNITFTPAERSGGNIYGTDIGSGLTAYTQGAPIKDPSVLRQQIGLPATPETAPETMAATSGGGGNKKKNIADKGLKAQLKIYGADNKIGGKEYKKLINQGYTPEKIVKRLDTLNENKNLKIGLGSNVLNKIGKSIAADPFSAISIPGAGNVAARGFGEGKVGQAIKQLAGGTEAPGQRTSPAPAPNQLLKPEPGTVGTVGTAGTVGIQPGQVLRASGQVGTRQPTRVERQLANQAPISAAPNVTQPVTNMTAPVEPVAPAAPAASVGGDFGLEDLGADMGISASDQAYMDAIDSLSQGLLDQFSGSNQSPGDLGSIFEGINLNDPITAEILRKYGVGRNYNIDAIRAALRRPQGRSAYLRSSMGDGTNPLRSALSFAPQLTIA